MRKKQPVQELKVEPSSSFFFGKYVEANLVVTSHPKNKQSAIQSLFKKEHADITSQTIPRSIKVFKRQNIMFILKFPLLTSDIEKTLFFTSAWFGELFESFRMSFRLVK